MSIEKGCKWYFPPLTKGIEEKNTTDSDEETLRNQSSVEALVRESIQNSLDVHDGSNNPVIMEFKLGSIKNPLEQIPNFMEIKKYIEGSRDYIFSEGYDDATFVFNPMLQFLDGHTEAFPYLCVADYNTIGMNHNRFKAFTSKGSSFKSNKGAGGSYGIGKAAYYMASKIRTILVSSMYKDENEEKHVYFEGFSKLTTNKVDDEMHYDKGYYDVNEAEPIDSTDYIPDEFKRKKVGTSVYVMGIDDSKESCGKLYNDIVRTVVRNFWLAILDERLQVVIDFEDDNTHSLIIDKNELSKIIKSYNDYDIKSEYINPRPYYEAVVNAIEFKSKEDNPPAVYFVNNHETFGKAVFYLIKNEQRHDRYLKMRSPRMFVSLEKTIAVR